MKPLVVFDLDGTLADSRAAILQSFAVACEAVGKPRLADQAVLELVGLPLVEMLSRLVPEDTEVALDAYRQAYPRLEDEHTRLFDGVASLLDALGDGGHALAIATGKSRKGLVHTCANLRLACRMQAMLSTDDVSRGKPHPDMLLAVLEACAATPGQAVMVGDTTFDMAMARAARVRGVGVSWGSHDEKRLREAGASTVVHSPEALLEVLLQ